MSTNVETKLANLLVSLREGAATANQVADQIEAAILAMYEKEDKEVEQPAPSKPSFKINSDILSLVQGELVDFIMSPKNITDLRDYAFIDVQANSNSSVSFIYTTATNYTRLCFMKSMSPEVMEMLEEGKTYVVHNSKRNGKNFWDSALEVSGARSTIYHRAKKLAKLFAELKKEGKL